MQVTSSTRYSSPSIVDRRPLQREQLSPMMLLADLAVKEHADRLIPVRQRTRNTRLTMIVENACAQAEVYTDNYAIYKYLAKRNIYDPSEGMLIWLIDHYNHGPKVRCRMCSIDIGPGPSWGICRLCAEVQKCYY